MYQTWKLNFTIYNIIKGILKLVMWLKQLLFGGAVNLWSIHTSTVSWHKQELCRQFQRVAGGGCNNNVTTTACDSLELPTELLLTDLRDDRAVQVRMFSCENGVWTWTGAAFRVPTFACDEYCFLIKSPTISSYSSTSTSVSSVMSEESWFNQINCFWITTS